MKVLSVAAALLATVSSLSLSVDAAAPCASLAANKKSAQALLNGVFNSKDTSAVDKYIGGVYLQHNPAVPDGPQSLKDFAALFTNETKVEFGAIAANGDLVWVNTRYTGLPGTPVMVGLDAFRFDSNGKIVEHWDILQAEVTKTASGRPMFPIQGSATVKAPTACGDRGCKTSDPILAANKKTGKALLDEVFNKKDVLAVDRYIGSVYLQHNPAVPDGAQSLKDFAATLTNETKVEVGAVAAEGDLVWLNTRYTRLPGLSTSVGVDVFRLANGKIIEHWDILQTEVPASKTASGRPMFPIKA